jgi:hypothetical protein
VVKVTREMALKPGSSLRVAVCGLLTLRLRITACAEQHSTAQHHALILIVKRTTIAERSDTLRLTCCAVQDSFPARRLTFVILMAEVVAMKHVFAAVGAHSAHRAVTRSRWRHIWGSCNQRD